MQIDFDNAIFPIRKVGNGKKYLVIFMHGYGSDGRDMAGLSELFDTVLNDAIWLCPNAPDRTPIGGFQWFDLSDISQRELDTGAEKAGPWVIEFISQALEYYNIPPENLIIGGFSQGAMMSFYTALRLETAPTAVLAFSGALTSENSLDSELKSRPPVFICHGEADPIVFSSYAERADKKLRSLNVPVETHIYPDYLHTIPPEGMKAALHFLKGVL